MSDVRLKLSALKTNLTYPLSNNVSHKRCLIHVKLPDFSMKTVESLLDNEKGAFFSLWFDESGGRMSIPVDQNDSRIFQFKTAPLQEGEGQSSLECVHQALASPSHSKDHLLSCLGVMEHRITVQGTDEVYKRTKQQMEKAEKLRKEQRTQEIKVPQSRKLKPERISPVSVAVRKQSRPKPPVSGSSKPAVVKRSGATSLSKPPPKTATTALPMHDPKPSARPSGRSTHTLKERVIHILALKPHTREQLVANLKKATKRSETAMSNLDSILEEVSELTHDSLYKLKPQHIKDLQVDHWPFYSEAQRQFLKRHKPLGENTSESGLSSKRPGENQTETVPKKPKLTSGAPVLILSSNNPSTSSPALPNQPDSNPMTSQSHQSELPGARGAQEEQEVMEVQCGEVSGECVSTKHGVKKKKKKKKKEEVEVVASDPTSTTSIPDHMSQFPTLVNDEERQRYKQIFNKEYVDYLQLKESIDLISNQYQKDCSSLSERLDSVPQQSNEYKEVKKLIQGKYRELHQNRSYLENKNKFDELHQKLNHIKRMILQYDAKQR